MVTTILILVLVALCVVCVFMGYAAMNGCLVSQLWWMTGGFKMCAEVIGAVFAGIVEGFGS